MQLVVFGCGTLGTQIARGWRGSVVGVTQTLDHHDSVRHEVPGIEMSTTLTAQGVAVICAPSSNQHRLIDALSPPTQRVVLVSTTAVYSPYQGVVTADSAPGTGERATGCLSIEERFRQWAGARGRVLRLGGLFNRTRGPAAVFARTRRARLAPPNVPLPLIHYQDAAALALDLLLHPEPPSITLGVAHQPTRVVFYSSLAAHLGCEPPAFSDPIPTPHRFEGRAPADPLPWQDFSAL